MELISVVESLEHQTILVTGATGFLAKLFVEKLLRIQPNLKQLYLLIRAPNSAAAAQRLKNEVSGEVFRVLRTKHGVTYNSFISEKVTPIAGDISLENLGISDSNMINKIWKEVDVVANFAAVTKFDERYDVVIRTNTMGARHVLEFSKKCEKLKLLLHISTAYVCGEKSGLILENPLRMGEPLNGTKSPELLDIEVEMTLISGRLNELKANQASQKEEMIAMKEFGLERARLFGWPNSYVFTKAMGEMIISESKGHDHKIVILRPTIVTSTLKEPFPGWIEGVRTIDSVFLAFGKGKCRCTAANSQTILDIPADLVVNAAIVAMVSHAHQPSDGDDRPFIYHSASSAKAPLHGIKLINYGYNYFSKNPMISPPSKGESFGKPIKISSPLIFPTVASFLIFFYVTCVFPVKVMLLLNTVFGDYFHDICSIAERKIKLLLRMIELYKPYASFKGIFDDSNTERLRMEVRLDKAEANMLCFDPKCINWEDYFMNVHIPGLVKYVFK
ncbi:hypothetical protein MKW92_020179 [Papaver armeniacum]|nr:hypothetical protein MKW92_020179 [Papaver armeniacum]